MRSGLQVSFFSKTFKIVLIATFHYFNLHLFILATNPPTDHTSSFDHHNALTDLSGQGVYMQHKKYMYHFTCDESTCEWEIMPQQFGKSLHDPVMMYLPYSYGCASPSIKACEDKENQKKCKKWKKKGKCSKNDIALKCKKTCGEC